MADDDNGRSAYFQTCAIPKPAPRVKKTPQRIKRRSKSLSERTHIADVRAYIIGRERNVCRCCRVRVGQSMHELRPRSLGGKVSRKNSVWVCGDGVQGCHGLIQRHEIVADYREDGAEGVIYFLPNTQQARDWLKLKTGERIESELMAQMEAAE